jgi:hypothetical protein
VRAERGRKKKLIIAFHYHLANQGASRAGWDCESCRRHGLEKKRRCGFIAPREREERHVVWGRKQVFTEECPKSLVNGATLALLEEFLVNRRMGIGITLATDARKVDAFLILKEQMEREERDVTTEH